MRKLVNELGFVVCLTQHGGKSMLAGNGRNVLAPRKQQRGAGQLKAIIVTLILLLGIYSAWKIVPAYINDYQLHDKLVDEARYSSVNHRTDEQIRAIIFQQIEDLGIPARSEDIKIENSGRSVRITVDYNVPVDVLGYHTVLHFTPTSENKAL